MSLDGNILTITTRKIGSSPLQITAYDGSNKSVQITITVVCYPADRQLDLFPVPVKRDGVMNIRLNDADGEAEVTLYNTSTGARVLSGQVTLKPNTPGRMDLSSLSSGNYRVVVKFDGVEMSKNITKL